MKARGKLVSLLMALVCLLPIGVGLLGFGDSATAADPGEVTVTLHKKKMDEFPLSGFQNTGKVMQEFNNYKPLEGVEFTPYDITEDFYKELAKEGLTGSESEAEYNAAVKRVMQIFTDPEKAPGKTPAASAKRTDAQGEVVFPDLPDRDTDGTYKVYLFVETDDGEHEQYSQPVVLALPILDKDNNDAPIKDIHLYPKNKFDNKPVKQLIDDDGTVLDSEDRYSYDLGKEIKYKATFVIPSHIGETVKNSDGTDLKTRYSKLIFKDAVDKDGVAFNGISDIKVGNTSLKNDLLNKQIYVENQFTNVPGVDYQATGKKAGFEMKFKLNAATSPGTDYNESKMVADFLSNYAGETLEIYYSVKLTEDTKVDEDIKNQFTVTLNNGVDGDETLEPDDEVPPVTHGGKKFVKHESTDPSQTLKGAEFVVTKEDKVTKKTVYLTGNTNAYTWTEVTDDKYQNAIKLTSLDNGVFEIKGLEYGNYNLVETKAPNGFKLAENPIPFEVSKNSYSVEDILRQGVPNTSRDGFLPSTGGAGIIAFLVIGLSLMGIAIVRYRKTQHAA